VKFLVDAQLPPRLVGWFVSRRLEARHVGDLENGLRLPDVEIWRIAADDGSIIVSKDSDFLDLAAVHGTPPIVLLVGVGNVSTATLLQLLDDAWPAVSVELARDDAGVVTLERERIVVLRRC
jgi:predicted nuclease of predicted toxin-antitoxin system